MKVVLLNRSSNKQQHLPILTFHLFYFTMWLACAMCILFVNSLMSPYVICKCEYCLFAVRSGHLLSLCVIFPIRCGVYPFPKTVALYLCDAVHCIRKEETENKIRLAPKSKWYLESQIDGLQANCKYNQPIRKYE